MAESKAFAFDDKGFEEIFGAEAVPSPAEDLIESVTDSVRGESPPPPKRMMTRSRAAAASTFNIHEMAAARFVDSSPILSAPDSISPQDLQPGKHYKFVYFGGSKPGNTKVAKMQRWTNMKHTTALFWENAMPKTQRQQDGEDFSVQPPSRGSRVIIGSFLVRNLLRSILSFTIFLAVLGTVLGTRLEQPVFRRCF